MTIIAHYPTAAAKPSFEAGDLLRRLERVETGSLLANITVPRTHEGLQPPCASDVPRCAGALLQPIERGLLKAASVCESDRIEEIDPEELATSDPDGLMFVNVNTPHDYERAKDLMDRVPGSDAMRGDRITDAGGRPHGDSGTTPHTT